MKRVTIAALTSLWLVMLTAPGALAAESTPHAPMRAAAGYDSGPRGVGSTKRPKLRWARPQLVLGASLGTAGYNRVDSWSDFGAGPVADVRAGVQLFPWIAIEARAMLTRHESVGSIVLHAEAIEGRLSYPGWFRPYLSGGFGRYDVTAYAASGARAAAPAGAAAVPVSAGLEVLATDSIGLQAEGTYWMLFSDQKATGSLALASIWGATVGGRFYF
jgi:hypothetical protein